jgi:septal ring factor EnvC (AmiA/AmiB activator)
MTIRFFPTKRHGRGRNFFRLPMVYPLLLSIFLFVFVVRPLMATGNPKPGTILAPTLNMRSGPGLHHPPTDKLRRGDQVLVLSYEGEWVRILFKDQTGFIMNRASYLRIDEPNSVLDSSPAGQDDQNDEVNRKLEASAEKIASFSKEETAIVGALEETERALDSARKKVTRLTKELASVEKQIVTLEGKYRDMEQRAETMEHYVADRLAALYKLSWLGKFHVLASADSMVDFFSRKRSMEQILVHDEAVMMQLGRDKAQMQALLNQLVDRKREKHATTADLSAKIDALNAKQTQREGLLAEIKSKKSLQLATIASLRASARELDRAVEAFGTAEVQEAPPPLVVTEKPFAALKGLLMMPVKGKIISFFGPFKDQRFNVTNFQSGITIKADRGEPIRAVYSGRTLFSSWFKGFGNMMIIDHGDHYYTVYAHLEELFKSKGDPVETGEVIATVGDTGSLTGAGLHFEVRHHGKPMNPMGWIKKG